MYMYVRSRNPLRHKHVLVQYLYALESPYFMDTYFYQSRTVPVRGRNPVRHGPVFFSKQYSTFTLLKNQRRRSTPYGVRRTPGIRSCTDVCSCTASGTVPQGISSAYMYQYMYLKVLSDPCRRGFRQRTGTDVPRAPLDYSRLMQIIEDYCICHMIYNNLH